MTAECFKNKFLPLNRKLYQIAFHIVENQADAEDLVQEAYIKLWENRKNLNELSNNEAFAVTILKNTCFDFLKKRKIEFDKFNTENIDLQIFTDEADTKESAVLIKSLISRLPEPQRKIMKLKHLYGFSDREISQTTGLTEGNIRVIVSRTRKLIKEKFLQIC
jgi:RNA polymerase sigma-70 factor (ECF subfamily)